MKVLTSVSEFEKGERGGVLRVVGGRLILPGEVVFYYHSPAASIFFLYG